MAEMDVTKLANLMPGRSHDLFKCGHCNKVASQCYIPVGEDWAYRLWCSCGKDWFVCRRCSTQRKRLVNKDRISRHKTNCSRNLEKKTDMESTNKRVLHPMKTPPTGIQPKQENTNESKDIMIDNVSGRLTENEIATVFNPSITNHLFCSCPIQITSNKKRFGDKDFSLKRLEEKAAIIPDQFSGDDIELPDWRDLVKNDCTMRFFEEENKGKGRGKLHLALTTMLRCDLLNDTYSVPEDEIDLFIKTGQLVGEMTRGQRGLLAQVLFLAEQCTRKNTIRDMQSKVETHQHLDKGILSIPVAKSDKELRRRYITGKFSLKETLPHPKASLLRSGLCAVGSITDCVADFLAHGVPTTCISATATGIMEIISKDMPFDSPVDR